MARVGLKSKKSDLSSIRKVPTGDTGESDDPKDLNLKQTIDKLSLQELKDHLTAFNLPATGLKKALQLRLFTHMKENKIYEFKTKQPAKTPKKKVVAKKPKKIIEESSSDEDSYEDNEDDSKKVTTNEVKKKNSSDEQAVWQWADDSATGSQDLWRDYSPALQSKLSKAYKNKEKKVRVDTQRFVDLSQSPFLQKRYDDPTRRRLVRRVVKNSSTTTLSEESSSDSDVEIEVSSSDSEEQQKEEESEEEEEEEEEEQQNCVEWVWAGDSPNGGHQDIWVPYSATLSKTIEDAWNKGEKEVKVDDERFVDLQNMLQRRFDDKMKRRSVKRKVLQKKQSSTKKTKSIAKNAIKPTATKKGGKLVLGSKSYQVQQLKQKGVNIVNDEDDSKKTTTGKRKRIEESSDQDEDEEEQPAQKKAKKNEDFSFAKSLNLPDTWGAHASMNTKEIILPSSSKEFQMIQSMMSNTVAGYHKNNTSNHPVRFTDFKVSKVIRVQNPMLWIRYSHRKAAMIAEYNSVPSNSVGTILTGPSTDQPANEYFLFHGLNENGIPGITRFGFDPRYCSLQGMFGAGLYFAENSSKANQYCHGGSCTASGFLTGRAQCRCKKSEEACILICRVALGDPFIEMKYRGNSEGDYWCGRRREVEKTGRGQKGVYNSVIGESKQNGGNPLLLREYVVYDSAQVYPEYIVHYYRK